MSATAMAMTTAMTTVMATAMATAMTRATTTTIASATTTRVGQEQRRKQKRSATTTAITIETVQDKVLTLTISTAAVTVLKSCLALYLPLKQGCQLMFMPKQPSLANS